MATVCVLRNVITKIIVLEVSPKTSNSSSCYPGGEGDGEIRVAGVWVGSPAMLIVVPHIFEAGVITQHPSPVLVITLGTVVMLITVIMPTTLNGVQHG